MALVLRPMPRPRFRWARVSGGTTQPSRVFGSPLAAAAVALVGGTIGRIELMTWPAGSPGDRSGEEVTHRPPHPRHHCSRPRRASPWRAGHDTGQTGGTIH